MRQLPPRTTLPTKTRNKLAEKAQRIQQAADWKSEAERLYEGARTDLNDQDPRAAGTRNLLKLDRQALQESRRQRRKELVRSVEDSLARYRTAELLGHQSSIDELRRAAGLVPAG